MSRKTGQRGEILARQFLEQAGYDIVATNFQARQGELDLIANDQGVLVFVEVKYRRSEVCGHPLEAVTPAKIRHLAQAARYYLYRHPHSGAIRFDLLGILERPGEPPAFEHLPDALAL